MLIGAAGWWALLEITVLAYFAIIGFMTVFIFAEFLLFPGKICSTRAVMDAVGWHSKRNWPARALLAQPRGGYE